ncbi:Uncharacterised protein [Slackia heliotrinireducens]|jgi:SAM-dependent methyltransferase|nr:class I SAM-dependent methyltransferase [Slackia heliotrinireducens]VEG99619.1 Uncharacterised protein [Slackia heliotrinireducens]
MDKRTAEILCELNNGFYRANAASFAETRNHPWPGWARCMDVMGKPDTVLDLACGSLRFERFLPDAIAYAVDACDPLVEEAGGAGPNVRFQKLDIIRILLDGGDLTEAIEAPMCDAAVCFGFMHHVPGFDRRVAVLKALVDCVRPGGHVCVSFWQFMNNGKLAEKARCTTEAACAEIGLDQDVLEENDYLIGWQNAVGAYRYCHHFTNGEVEQLAQAVSDGACAVEFFNADGRTGDMNRYCVLRRL